MFAKLTGSVAIRWKSDARFWEGKPQAEDHIEEAEEDDAFHEWFVQGINGYISDNISKHAKLINGTFVKYHSLCLSDVDQMAFHNRLSNAVPGDVITLEHPPLSINVSILQEETSKQRIEVWKDLSLVPGEVVIALIAKRSAKSQKDIRPTCIPGGTFCGPSQIRIKNCFPIEPSFAMTVDKAQGRTMSLSLIHI